MADASGRLGPPNKGAKAAGRLTAWVRLAGAAKAAAKAAASGLAGVVAAAAERFANWRGPANGKDPANRG